MAYFEDRNGPGTVVVGTVVDAITRTGSAHSKVIDMRSESDVLAFELRVGTRDDGHDVSSVDRLLVVHHIQGDQLGVSHRKGFLGGIRALHRIVGREALAVEDSLG